MHDGHDTAAYISPFFSLLLLAPLFHIVCRANLREILPSRMAAANEMRKYLAIIMAA